MTVAEEHLPQLNWPVAEGVSGGGVAGWLIPASYCLLRAMPPQYVLEGLGQRGGRRFTVAHGAWMIKALAVVAVVLVVAAWVCVGLGVKGRVSYVRTVAMGTAGSFGSC